MRTKSGEVIPFELFSKPSNFFGQPALACVARDISGTIELRDLRELNRLKDEFLNIATHELRTPLTSIIGMSEIVNKEASLSPEQHKFLNIIRDEGERLNRTIKQILTSTRYENKRGILNIAPLDLKEFFERLLPALRSIARAKDDKIDLVFGEGGREVMTDKEKISQVIYDLIDNAVKFGPPGQSIIIAVSRLKDQTTKIEVCDQGPGITQDEQDKIFVKFGQLDSSISRNQEGIGLGLYTAKLIIGDLGGKIGVTSEPGKGSKFWFTLPI